MAMTKVPPTQVPARERKSDISFTKGNKTNCWHAPFHFIGRMKQTHHGEGSHPQADPPVGQKRRLLLPAARSLAQFPRPPRRPEAHRQQERVEDHHHHHTCYFESHGDPAVDGAPDFYRLVRPSAPGRGAVLALIRRAELSRPPCPFTLSDVR